MRRAWLLAAILSWPVAAWASDDPTKLFLDGSGTVEMVPDQLEAGVLATDTGADAATVQRRVDAALATAAHDAAGVAGVEIQLRGYVMSRDEKGRWTAEGRLALRSGDPGALLGLVAREQAAGLALEQLDWTLSATRRRDAVDRATDAALADLRRRANNAAHAMGLTLGAFSEIHLSDVDGMRRPMMRNLAMQANAALAPAAPAGTQEVGVDANAIVALLP